MARPLVSFEFNPASLARIRYLANYVDTMPNRIHNIKLNAVNRAARRMKTYLRDKYGTAGKGMFVSTRMRSSGIALVISTERAPKPTGSEMSKYDKQLWAANQLFYGRKGYTIRSRGKMMKLRDASVGKYPRYLSVARIPAMSPNQSAKSDIRRQASRFVSDAIVIETRRQGFGARGGNPGNIGDTVRVTDSKNPSGRVPQF